MSDVGSMDGKVALVIGGSTGIGARTARLLAQRGAKVAIVGIGQDELDQVVAAIKSEGGEAIALLADITSEAAVADMISATVDHFGALQAMHCNAALTSHSEMQKDVLLADLDFSTWDKTMAVNVRGLALCAKHAIPRMIASGGGSIVFSGSVRGSQGHLEFTAYGVSKAALEALSRYIATQYGKESIRSNIVEIGLVQSDTGHSMLTVEARDFYLQHHLTPELGRTDDVARVVAFLLSDEARFVTGAKVAADGGLGAHASIYADLRRNATA